jgi:voltage-gated potassium channel
MSEPRAHDEVHHMRQPLRCLLLLGTLVAIGVLGYMWIEGWSASDALYMTVNTISTVGAGEPHALSPAGRTFTSLLILLGVGTFAYLFAKFGEAVFGRQMRNYMERRMMSKQIRKTSDHVVVCGCGSMGGLVIDGLLAKNRPVIAIDNDSEVIDRLIARGIKTILGNATEEAVLLEAGVERAGTLIATLANDADNLFLTLTARDLNPDLTIIVRADTEANERKFTRAGASRVISPQTSGANAIVRVLTRPGVVDLMELVTSEENLELEVSEHVLAADDKMVGRTLAEARVRQTLGAMVMAVRRADGHLLFDPAPDARLEIGDKLYLVRATDDGDRDSV